MPRKVAKVLAGPCDIASFNVSYSIGKKQTNKKTYDFSSLGNLEGHSNNIK